MKHSPDHPDKQLATLEGLLREPFGLEFPEPIRKMRTQLLIACVVGFTAFYFGLIPKSDTPIFGVTFENLTQERLLMLLWVVVFYLWCHFSWSSWDYYQEWRLRSTGTKKFTSTASLGFSVPPLDEHTDPRQSTLYHWWLKRAEDMQRYLDMHLDANENLKSFEEKIKGSEEVEVSNPEHERLRKERLLLQVEELRGKIDASRAKAELFLELAQSPRIPASLERFDRSFKRFLSSQNYRFLFLELLLPFLGGIGVIALGVRAIWCSG